MSDQWLDISIISQLTSLYMHSTGAVQRLIATQHNSATNSFNIMSHSATIEWTLLSAQSQYW